MVNVKKTKTVVVRDRDIQKHNETYKDNRITTDSREISFVVPIEMTIDQREIDILLATYAGVISIKDMRDMLK